MTVYRIKTEDTQKIITILNEKGVVFSIHGDELFAPDECGEILGSEGITLYKEGKQQ